MQNKRIDELSFMFSEITGIDKENSRKIIESTKTGKAILKNNPLVLYEQQTSNLAEIINDLSKSKKYKSISSSISSITIDRIIEASKKLRKYESSQEHKVALYFSASEPKLKKKQQNKLIKAQKYRLKTKQHDALSTRRAINAYKSQG